MQAVYEPLACKFDNTFLATLVQTWQTFMRCSTKSNTRCLPVSVSGECKNNHEVGMFAWSITSSNTPYQTNNVCTKALNRISKHSKSFFLPGMCTYILVNTALRASSAGWAATNWGRARKNEASIIKAKLTCDRLKASKCQVQIVTCQKAKQSKAKHSTAKQSQAKQS